MVLFNLYLILMVCIVIRSQYFYAISCTKLFAIFAGYYWVFSTVLAKILFATVKTQPWYVVKFEQPEVRELKMILSGQNEIYRSLKTLVVKLDEIVGRQERELSLLTTISQQQNQAAPPSDRNQVSFLVLSLSSSSVRTIPNKAPNIQ